MAAGRRTTSVRYTPLEPVILRLAVIGAELVFADDEDLAAQGSVARTSRPAHQLTASPMQTIQSSSADVLPPGRETAPGSCPPATRTAGCRAQGFSGGSGSGRSTPQHLFGSTSIRAPGCVFHPPKQRRGLGRRRRVAPPAGPAASGARQRLDHLLGRDLDRRLCSAVTGWPVG